MKLYNLITIAYVIVGLLILLYLTYVEYKFEIKGYQCLQGLIIFDVLYIGFSTIILYDIFKNEK